VRSAIGTELRTLTRIALFGDPGTRQNAEKKTSVPSRKDRDATENAIPNGPDGDRRRRLWGFSRHPETPRQLVIELTADGTDYTALGDFTEPELTAWFAECELAATYASPPGVENEEDGARIRICRQPRATWAALWPEIAGLG